MNITEDIISECRMKAVNAFEFEQSAMLNGSDIRRSLIPTAHS